MVDDQSAEVSAYNGRWVALVRGKIISQGDTREQAFQSARRSRSKENIEIRFMPVMPVSSPLLEAVQAAIPSGEPAYLVGGAVRDAVLGRASRDLDFACLHGINTARTVADALKAAFYPMDETFDTGRVIVQNPDGSRDILDFAGFRGENLDSDLRGRDFTINAVAMDLATGLIIDPLGGVKDIHDKHIRACSESALSDDSVRILRGVRQAAAYGFAIDPGTRKLMKESASLLTNISPERMRDELCKILSGPKPDSCVRALEMLGLFPYVLPELTLLKGVEQSAPHVHDVWTHTLAVLRHLEGILEVLSPRYNEQKANSDLMNSLVSLKLGKYRAQINEHLGKNLNVDRSARSVLFFAALYHDVNKPQTKSIEENGRIRFLGHDELGAQTVVKRAAALHFSNDELERLRVIIQHHMRIHGQTSRKDAGMETSRKAIYRFFRDTGEAGIDLILLALADTRATFDHTLTQEHWTAALDVSRTLLEAFYEKSDEIIKPPALLNGDDLITVLKQRPGPELGKLLETIRENQAAGSLTTREEAFAFARSWLVTAREAGQKAKTSGQA